MATKAQLIEQLAAANDALVRSGRTVEELRGQLARLRPVGYTPSRTETRAARITTEQRRLLAPAYFDAHPNATSVTDQQLSDWASGRAA